MLLRFNQERVQRMFGIGMIAAAAFLWMAGPILWVALLLWFPLAAAIGTLLDIIALEIKPPRLERYIPRGSLGLRD